MKRTSNQALDFNTGCCSYRLHTCYLITGITHALLFVSTLTVAILFELNESIRLPHIITPVTQTIGVWVNSSQIHANTNRYFGDGASLDAQCQFAQASPSRMDGVTILPVVLSYGWLNIQYMIPCFFLLSALFQCSYPLTDLLSWIITWQCICPCSSYNPLDAKKERPWHERYYDTLNEGKVHRTHFVEYSFSASLMVLIICAQLGITDLTTLILTFAATWACMMFGLLAELFVETDVKLNLNLLVYVLLLPAEALAHFCGWVVLVAAIIGALSNLVNSVKCVDGLQIPDFVIPVITIEFLLFISFGFVQSLSIYDYIQLKNDISIQKEQKDQQRIKIACTAEYRYILLSLVAKTTLAIGIFAGLYQVKQQGHPQ